MFWSDFLFSTKISLVYFLRPEDDFPPVEMADDEGLLAVTSFLNKDRIKMPIKKGSFPGTMRDSLFCGGRQTREWYYFPRN